MEPEEFKKLLDAYNFVTEHSEGFELFASEDFSEFSVSIPELDLYFNIKNLIN